MTEHNATAEGKEQEEREIYMLALALPVRLPGDRNSSREALVERQGIAVHLIERVAGGYLVSCHPERPREDCYRAEDENTTFVPEALAIAQWRRRRAIGTPPGPEAALPRKASAGPSAPIVGHRVPSARRDRI